MINYYAFYDSSLKLYNPPFQAFDDNAAIRLTRNMLISSGDDIMSKMVPFCELFHNGTFDEVSGTFSSLKKPRKVCSLSSIPLPANDVIDESEGVT